MRASISPYDVHVYIARYLCFYGKRLVRFDLKLEQILLHDKAEAKIRLFCSLKY